MRGAVFKISLKALRSLLNLPEGVEIHHLYPDDYGRSLAVIVQGEMFPEVEDGCVPLEVMPKFEVMTQRIRFIGWEGLDADRHNEGRSENSTTR